MHEKIRVIISSFVTRQSFARIKHSLLQLYMDLLFLKQSSSLTLTVNMPFLFTKIKRFELVDIR